MKIFVLSILVAVLHRFSVVPTYRERAPIIYVSKQIADTYKMINNNSNG